MNINNLSILPRLPPRVLEVVLYTQTVTILSIALTSISKSNLQKTIRKVQEADILFTCGFERVITNGTGLEAI